MTRIDAEVLQTSAQTEERTAPRQLDDFERDLQRGLEDTLRQSPFLVRDRHSQRHGVSACLRGAFALFFGVAKAPTDCRYNTSIVPIIEEFFPI